MVAVKGDVIAAKPRSGRSCCRCDCVKDVYSSRLGAGASSRLPAASLPSSASPTPAEGEAVISPDMTPSWCLGEAGRAKSGGVRLPTGGFRLAAIARHASAGKPPPSPHPTPEHKPPSLYAHLVQLSITPLSWCAISNGAGQEVQHDASRPIPPSPAPVARKRCLL